MTSVRIDLADLRSALAGFRLMGFTKASADRRRETSPKISKREG